MLNKYWREYPIFLQLVLFTLMVFTIYYFTFLVFATLVPLYNHASSFGLADVSKPLTQQVITSLKLRQAVGSCSIFVIPTLLFAYLTTPRPVEYLGFKKPGKNIQWLWVLLGMTSLIPVLVYMSKLMRFINFGTSVAQAQVLNDRLVEAMLHMDSFGSFIAVFLLLAVLPAVGEEMMFRGLILKFGAKRKNAFMPIGMGANMLFPELSNTVIPLKKMFYPLFISGFMFAFMHSDVYGLPSILLAGIALGGIYYLTGSLWCSILGHIINNGLQIVLIYAFRNNTAMQEVVNGNNIPWYIAVAGLALATVSFWQLWINRTPLTYGWTEDFTPEEIINRTQE